MSLKLFNTLSRTVEEFIPMDPGGKHVGLYCCGPTIHDYSHIGNFRTCVFTDLTRRYLQFKGYDVRHVMNITDVEDKIIKRISDTKSTLGDYTAKYRDGVLRGFSGAQLPASARNSSGHRAYRGYHRADRKARRARHRVSSSGWVGLFQHREISGGGRKLWPIAQVELRSYAARRTRCQ